MTQPKEPNDPPRGAGVPRGTSPEERHEQWQTLSAHERRMHPDLPTSLDPGMARIGCAILSLSMLIGAVLIWSIGMAIWKVLFDG